MIQLNLQLYSNSGWLGKVFNMVFELKNKWYINVFVEAISKTNDTQN